MEQRSVDVGADGSVLGFQQFSEGDRAFGITRHSGDDVAGKLEELDRRHSKLRRQVREVKIAQDRVGGELLGREAIGCGVYLFHFIISIVRRATGALWWWGWLWDTLSRL